MSVTAQQAAEKFLNRTLWQREGQRRPDPLIALLAPRGSGKSSMLRMLSQECGGSVVHGVLDCATLPKGDDLIPVAANRIAFDLARKWDHLKQPPSFHRFRLAHLARDLPALPTDRNMALREMNRRIQDYADTTRAGRTSARTAQAAQQGLDLAAGVTSSTLPGLAAVVPPARDSAKALTRLLSQRASRMGVRKGMGYHGHSAESAEPIDALIALSQARPKDAAAELMDALLADLEADAHDRTLPVSCRCDIPTAPGGSARRPRHRHAWVLLVDNAQTESGRAFLAAVADARKRRAAHAAGEEVGSDPLLVVAAFNQWQDEWRQDWCEPWTVTASDSHRAPIPTFAEVSRSDWEAATAAEGGREPVARTWLPVWLDVRPPARRPDFPRSAWTGTPRDEVAELLCADHRGAHAVFGDALAQEAGRRHDPSASRPVGALMLRQVDHAGTVAPQWRHGLSDLPGELEVPDRYWVNPPDTVMAAAYLADPRSVADSRLPAGIPGLNGTLQSLRKHLWVSAVTPAPTESRTRHVRRPVLHPWLRQCLFTGLACAHSPTGPHAPDPQPADPRAAGPDPASWPTTPNDAWQRAFQRLRPMDGPDAEADPRNERQLFHDLALHQFSYVSRSMADDFDRDRHSVWVERMWYITSAPTALPLHETLQASYTRLVDEPRWRSDVEAPTAKLVLLLWLYNDPLTEATGYWDEQIAQGFRSLAGRSTQSDVDALLQAAARFSH